MAELIGFALRAAVTSFFCGALFWLMSYAVKERLPKASRIMDGIGNGLTLMALVIGCGAAIVMVWHV